MPQINKTAGSLQYFQHFKPLLKHTLCNLDDLKEFSADTANTVLKCQQQKYFTLICLLNGTYSVAMSFSILD